MSEPLGGNRPSDNSGDGHSPRKRGPGDNGDGSDTGDDEFDHGGGGGKDWVTVATFSVATAAHLARLKLENEGVACVILDEHLISTNWLLSPALGGIKLQVPLDLVDRAREILTGAGNITPNGWELVAAEQAKCKACGKGEYVAKAPPLWLVLVSVLTFGLPLLFVSRKPVCDACGAEMPDGLT